MGWRIGANGFQVVLSADVPKMVTQYLADDVDTFLAECGLRRLDLRRFVCHPGGPKVLTAFEEALQIDRAALAITWDSLSQMGNLSSASVLMILADTMRDARPQRGDYGLMLAMGPGFCSELVLMQW